MTKSLRWKRQIPQVLTFHAGSVVNEATSFALSNSVCNCVRTPSGTMETH